MTTTTMNPVILTLSGAEDATFEAAEISDERWNGWEIPRFTREQADQVASWLTKQDQGWPEMEFNPDLDAYQVSHENGDTEQWSLGTDGLYGPQGGWCWDVATFDPIEDAEAFVAIWANGATLMDLGEHMTCQEANALAQLLRAHGHFPQAHHLLAVHAAGDVEDGDLH